MSTPMSVRLGDDVRTRVERQARLAHDRPATYAARLIDEGTRAAAHPGIVFRSTPTGGRIAAVTDGPDVAELVKVVSGLSSRGDERVREAARWLDLPEQKVRFALGYFAEFSAEIDEELRIREDAATELQAQPDRQRDVLQ